MKVFRKFFLVILLVFVFGMFCNESILGAEKGICNTAEIKDPFTGENISREEGKSICLYGSADEIQISTSPFVGKRMITCGKHSDSLGNVYYDFGRAQDPPLGKQACVFTRDDAVWGNRTDHPCARETTTRQPDETACFENNIFYCDGFTGFFTPDKNCLPGREVCDDPAGKPAYCRNIEPCNQYGKTRETGGSACAQESNTKQFIAECIKERSDTNFKKKEDCQKDCIEYTSVFAECVQMNEYVCQKNNVKRKLGENACMDDGTLWKCVREQNSIKFVLEQDCAAQKKRCDVIDKRGKGKCVDLSETPTDFNPPEIEVQLGQKTNAFCPNLGPTSDNPSIYTALGCIPIDPAKFMVWLLPFIFGITGGIAFLIMVYSFILMTTSGGDPKKIQAAKETITSAIIGLLLSIFSLFILRLITSDILKIPGIN